MISAARYIQVFRGLSRGQLFEKRGVRVGLPRHPFSVVFEDTRVGLFQELSGDTGFRGVRIHCGGAIATEESLGNATRDRRGEGGSWSESSGQHRGHVTWRAPMGFRKELSGQVADLKNHASDAKSRLSLVG